MRLSMSIKSGVCKALKWDAGESVFYLKVPNLPETKELVVSLKKEGDPAAVYFSREGKVLAWQWSLKKGNHRSLYRYAQSV